MSARWKAEAQTATRLNATEVGSARRRDILLQEDFAYWLLLSLAASEGERRTRGRRTGTGGAPSASADDDGVAMPNPNPTHSGMGAEMLDSQPVQMGLTNALRTGNMVVDMVIVMMLPLFFGAIGRVLSEVSNETSPVAARIPSTTGAEKITVTLPLAAQPSA